MEYKEFDDKMTSMLSKIGNDSASLILDDTALLLTDKQNSENLIKAKDEEIEKLKSLNSRLQQVNSNLLLQIPVQKEERKEAEDKKDRKSFSYREAFDEFGNFKR